MWKNQRWATWAMVIGFAIIILLASTLDAKAATPITLTWETPTTYESGLEMPLDHIGWYEFEETLDGVPLQTWTLPNDATTATLQVKYRGVHCFIGYTITVDGLKSGPSNEACKEVTSGNPNPPKNVAAQ